MVILGNKTLQHIILAYAVGGTGQYLIAHRRNRLIPNAQRIYGNHNKQGEKNDNTLYRAAFFHNFIHVNNHALSINYLGKYSIVGKSLQEQTGHYARTQ